jgi:hypothetical protein
MGRVYQLPRFIGEVTEFVMTETIVFYVRVTYLNPITIYVLTRLNRPVPI